jgi:hypothetical protein
VWPAAEHSALPYALLAAAAESAPTALRMWIVLFMAPVPSDPVTGASAPQANPLLAKALP